MQNMNTLETKLARRADFEPVREGEKNAAIADLSIDGKSLYK